MQIAKKRIAAILIAIFLTLSMGASMMLIPSASAHTPAWQIPTHAYMTAYPNPIGVGQSVHIDMFLGNPPYYNSALTNNYRYHNYDLTIVAPDGTSSSITFAYISDPTDNQDYQFTPTQVGTYNLTFSYPGETITAADQPTGSAYVNDTYLPSSYTYALVVTQTPLPGLVSSTTAAPTAYWTRPIFGTNTAWYTISSNWLGTGSPVSSATGSGDLTGFTNSGPFQRYPGDAVGSTTSHIMWTQPTQEGGVVGGNDLIIPGNTYFEGSAYEQRFDNPIIVDGDLYYTLPVTFAGAQTGATVCQCLATGQIIWEKTNIPALSGAMIYDVENPDQHGVYPAILFTTNFGEVFDAYTGDFLFNVTGVPTGIAAQGPQGEQLRYVFANAGTNAAPNWTLAEWNATSLIFPYGYAMTPSIYNATGGGTIPVPAPMNGVNNPNSNNNNNNNFVEDASVWNTSLATNRYDWNISVPWLNFMGNQTLTTITNAAGDTQFIEGYQATPTTNPDASNPTTQLYAFYDDMMICRNGSLPTAGAWAPFTYFAVDLNVSHTNTFGNIIWMQTYQPPAGNVTVLTGPCDPTVGVFTLIYGNTMQFVGYSMTTGQELWGPTAPRAPLDYFGEPGTPDADAQAAYGNLYASGMAGLTYCYSMTTGNLIWTYGNGGEGNSTNSYGYVPLGYYPTFIQAIGNGIIYLSTAEHTIETPIFKYALTRAINATTGAEIWTLQDYTGEFQSVSYAIADGYTTFFNGYDDQIYCLGQGPSSTTVSASPTVTTYGDNVVVQGTVMDISEGTQQAEQKGDFPNGVPVCSDAIMNDWMGYVYQQQPEPNNFTGVPVTINVVDSNGNFRAIGTATTDAMGSYSLTWTPDIAGNYTVIATFAGNNGYWPSSAETHFNIMNSPATPGAPTASPTSVADTYFVPAIAGLFVLIIVGLAVIALLVLRKRP